MADGEGSTELEPSISMIRLLIAVTNSCSLSSDLGSQVTSKPDFVDAHIPLEIRLRAEGFLPVFSIFQHLRDTSAFSGFSSISSRSEVDPNLGFF
jgi:hypothetical protein